jgi:SPP1 gp7 family putative phage head morphogenesis protein
LFATWYYILLLALFLERYNDIFTVAKESYNEVFKEKHEQLSGIKYKRIVPRKIYTDILPDGVSAKDKIDIEAIYRAGQANKIITANKLSGIESEDTADIIEKNIQVELIKSKNALLKESEGGGYHGLLDAVMANIVGIAAIQAAKDTGAETYTFHAVNDDRTTPACRMLGSRTFKVSEMRLGYNVPPIAFYLNTGKPIPHPCRSWVTLNHDLTADGDSSIIQSGGGKMSDNISGAISGALNPNSDEAAEHSDKYYESVRKMKTDVNSIAKNTNFSIEDIQKIKDYVFLDNHDLGDGRIDRFDSDYMMAQSWQRLIDGKDIKSHDYTLLEHELLEREYEQQGIPHGKAHSLASKKYDYSGEAEKYYAEINKHKEK